MDVAVGDVCWRCRWLLFAYSYILVDDVVVAVGDVSYILIYS